MKDAFLIYASDSMKEYRDYYFRKAKAENYPARSVYKLQELDGRFRLLRKGMKVLDLGAAPGSWSLACAEKIGAFGVVLACDLQSTAVSFPPQVRFMQTDVFAVSEDFVAALGDLGPFDVILSDMAPATTGNKFTDQCRSLNLVRRSLELALEWLKPQGSYVAKIFQGPDVPAFRKEIKRYFTSTNSFKPKSSRAESKEDFLVCQGFKGAN